jgi:hypothetical protein
VPENRGRWIHLGDQNSGDPGLAARIVFDRLRDVPPERVPQRVCELSTELLPVSGASISLMAQSARRTLCSSDDRAAELMETQYTLGVGPCLTAFSSGAPVLAADLSGGADAHQWPVFAQQALQLGVKAVFSFPLAIGAIAAGTLDLYRDATGTLAEAELGVALLLADTATLSVLRIYSSSGETEYAQGAGDMAWLGGDAGHDEVHQATGMVMVQCGVGAEEALLRLRARAFADGVTLARLARDVVERRVRLDA